VCMKKTLQGVQTSESFKGSKEGESSGRVALCMRGETQVRRARRGSRQRSRPWRNSNSSKRRKKTHRKLRRAQQPSDRPEENRSGRPSSAFGETIVLSPIAADSVGGIIWGASSVPGGAQTPQGSRSSASETRSDIQHSFILV
jgi:hypothetical protein